LTSDECVLTSEVFDKDERERKRWREREGVGGETGDT